MSVPVTTGLAGRSAALCALLSLVAGLFLPLAALAPAEARPLIKTFKFPKEAYESSARPNFVAPLPSLRPDIASRDGAMAIATDTSAHDAHAEDDLMRIDEHGHPAYVHELERLFGTETRIGRVDQIDRLTVIGLDGQSANLKDMLKPGTIIHFWASWCVPCAEEIPELERFYRSALADPSKPSAIRLIAISNDVSAGPASRFMKQYGTTFPVFLDTRQKSNLALVGQRVLPATVLVGAGGRLHRLALGKLDWGHEGLSDILGATAVAAPHSRLESANEAIE